MARVYKVDNYARFILNVKVRTPIGVFTGNVWNRYNWEDSDKWTVDVRNAKKMNESTLAYATRVLQVAGKEHARMESEGDRIEKLVAEVPLPE